MNLGSGDTIFDKIELDYEVLRQKENPIQPIVNYYKSKLKPGQDLWWIENENGKSSSLIVKIWNTLTDSERIFIKNKAMVLFPEIFGNKGDKFNWLSLWLVTNESIVCPNIRDIFTAGGRVDLAFESGQYDAVPRIFQTLFENRMEIIQIIHDMDVVELSKFWRVPVSEENKFDTWLKIISSYAVLLSGTSPINMNDLLKSMFS